MLVRDWRVVFLIGIGRLCASQGLDGCVLATDWRDVCLQGIGGLCVC